MASQQKVIIPQPSHLYHGHKTPPHPSQARQASVEGKGRHLCFHTATTASPPPTQGNKSWAEAGVRRQGCRALSPLFSMHMETDPEPPPRPGLGCQMEVAMICSPR